MATASKKDDQAAKAKEREAKEKDGAKRDKARAKEREAKEKDGAKRDKARAKEREAKEKEKAKRDKAKAKEREAKEKEKEKAKRDEAKAKEREAKEKEKEKAKRDEAKAEEREARETEREAKETEAARGKGRASVKGGAGTGPRSRAGSTRPRGSRPSREGSPAPTVHDKGWIAEELGRADAVDRSTKRPTLAASFTTRDHDVIRRWAESRGGVPADVRGTGDGGPGGAGVLRIEFRDAEGRLEDVGWDDFFSTFDTSDVDFLYQEFTRDGAESRFHKIVRAGD